MKRKVEAAATSGVLNLATSGVSTDFANHWQSEVIAARSAELLARSAESHQFGLGSLKRAIRDAFLIPPEREIVTTLGASAGIRLVSELLLAGRPGAEVIIESPAYEPIRAIPERFGARVIPVERINGLASVAPLVTERTAAVFLTNLHNPTGHWLPHEAIAQVAQELEHANSHALVVVDETFSDIGPHPGISAAAAHPRIVTISSLSKSHGLAPLRCGWVTADPQVWPTFVVDSVLMQNIGCKLAEVLGAMAIENIAAFRQAARRRVDRNRALVEKWLTELTNAGLIASLPSISGCIAFPRVVAGAGTLQFVEQLKLKFGVLVVPGIFFGPEFDDYIRIGFGGDYEHLQRGLTRLAEGLATIRP